MKNSSIKNFLSPCFVFLILINTILCSSCASAQDNTSRNQKADLPAEKNVTNFGRLQSINSCTVMELPHDIFKNGFNPVGGYIVFRETPSNFNDFLNFTLDKPWTLNDSPDKKTDLSTVKIVGGVVIETGEAESETYEIEKLSITPQEIRFSTKTIHNIRYEFEGRFLKTGDFIDRFNDKDIPVLQGVLKKYQSEKLVKKGILKLKFRIWKEIFPVDC